MPDFKLSFLQAAHDELGWPKPEQINNPRGGGTTALMGRAKAKVGSALARLPDADDATVGILLPNSESKETSQPLAIVVQFQRRVSDATLRELHRLGWNFSHVPALITIEPGLLRVWTCCEPPDPNRELAEYQVHEVEELSLQSKAARALHWINLISGEFFRVHAHRFDREGRADQMLLGNLRYMRDMLAKADLTDDDICHDLIARIVFVQFLFDRKDSEGNAALTAAKLARLQTDGVLRKLHQDFSSILCDYQETYRLFDWLNERFNGDLFPGKGRTAAERARGWAAEKRVVTKQHLELLAEFISGAVDMPSGQICLWPMYSFDVIPLEFISSIYETFVSKRASKEGIFYTPSHLVDFILDRVLPWDHPNWDVSILDPACGSGIFLVKAYQRLVHRWKIANPHQPIRAETLRRLLERNILGVDKDPHAVRVACFSLYLAMCDEIEPRHYWTQVTFPPMRGSRLLNADFFDERIDLISSDNPEPKVDLIIGNAPWGERLLTEFAAEWARRFGWPVANFDIGKLFMPKAALLLKPDGRAALIQSASSLLFNNSKNVASFRKRFFSTLRVREIVNLSALRFRVFKQKSHTARVSVSPACVVTFENCKPQLDDEFEYISPKSADEHVDNMRIIVDPFDRRVVSTREAIESTDVWTALMWGGPRDRALIARLREFPSIRSVRSEAGLVWREGIIFGDRSVPRPELDGRKLLAEPEFPSTPGLELDAEALPVVRNIRTHSRDSTDLSAFAGPQVIIKQSWRVEEGRFQARTSNRRRGVLCTQSYVSVHAHPDHANWLNAICLCMNSVLALYYQQLTSGRFATYRPELRVLDLLDTPLPKPHARMLAGLKSNSDIDERTFEAFHLNVAERALVEDMCATTIVDFRSETSSPGRQKTERGMDSDLAAYCSFFINVMRAGFGSDRAVDATIFQEADECLPVRIVAFEFDAKEHGVSTKSLEETVLLRELMRLGDGKGAVRHGGIIGERVARIYDSSSGAPTVFLVKPDQRRHWTRSQAMHDADEVAADLFRWAKARTGGKR